MDCNQESNVSRAPDLSNKIPDSISDASNAELISAGSLTERYICDTKECSPNNKQQSDNQKLDSNSTQYTRWLMQTRIQVALLGLAIAVVNCYAQATFCIAIVEMVLPADFVFKNETSSSLVKITSNSTIESDEPVLPLEDQSCPVEYKYRDYYDSWRFQQSPAKSQDAIGKVNDNVINITNRFDWDAGKQGLLLGAFAIGTAPLQVLGGRLAEIYGAKWVLLVGCIGTALTNLTIPFLAHFSFILLIVNRVLMGVAQAGMEPGLMCLLAEWLTPAETGFFISMLLFAICVGFFLGSLCSSFILALGYGWPLAYYVAGGMNLFMAIIWSLYASSRPRESKLISMEELKFIEREQQVIKQQDQSASNNDKDNWILTQKISPMTSEIKSNNSITNLEDNIEQQQQAPWKNILTTRSVWAFIICKISIRWCADVLSIELPTYLANVLHLSIKLNGILNSVSSALFAIFSFITGYLVDGILKQQSADSIQGAQQSSGMSKTTLRKLMQSIASFGSALAVFLMTQYDCNILFSMSMLLVLSCCLVMGTGGELQIPYDMTSKYPGTLHGMACTLSVSGWLAPPLIGLILGDQPSSRYRWSLVWYLTAFINLIGGLVFLLFADASPRDFDAQDGSSKSREVDEQEAKSRLNNDNTLLEDGFGYYNAACKATDNTTPPLLPKTAKKRKYSNDNHHYDINCDSKEDCINNNRMAVRGYNQSRISASSSINDLNWTPRFDREPIQIRQVEESFIKPRYLNNIDSVASRTMIFPYREKHNSNTNLKSLSDTKVQTNEKQTENGNNRMLGRIPRTLWTWIISLSGSRRKEFKFTTNVS